MWKIISPHQNMSVLQEENTDYIDKKNSCNWTLQPHVNFGCPKFYSLFIPIKRSSNCSLQNNHKLLQNNIFLNISTYHLSSMCLLRNSDIISNAWNIQNIKIFHFCFKCLWARLLFLKSLLLFYNCYYKINPCALVCSGCLGKTIDWDVSGPQIFIFSSSGEWPSLRFKTMFLIGLRLMRATGFQKIAFFLKSSHVRKKNKLSELPWSVHQVGGLPFD